MSVSAVSAGVLAFALSASATVRTLPTPPPSNFIDTEASTNVVFAPLQEDTRQYVLRFAGDFSPSNDLEVAFGGDANGDDDLSPEETEARFGVDCGEKKVKVEERGSGVSPLIEDGSSAFLTSGEDAASPLAGSTSRFDLRLTRDQQARWNLMKVTQRGFFSSEPTVTLKPHRPGMMIIVR